MDYKEKLEEAKRLYETANADQKYLLESLFPELKSKAYDRIRKNCIHFLNLQKSHHASTVEIDECIAWLEGQGEQKSWTISDAEDGDVLATDDWVFIFEKIRSNGKPVCYCHYDVDLGFVIDVNTYISTGSTIRPATKEQRDTLFAKMKEAGYEWDAEKKELKKIEQNPVWSEEDEAMCNSIIDTELQIVRITEGIQNFFADTEPFKEKYCREIRWIESIKNRLQSKSLWKPTDEQISALEYHLNNTYNESWQCAVIKQLLDDLKQLYDYA